MITKTYVNNLRYVSAYGKKSILEITTPIIKKGLKLTCSDSFELEYKTLPVGAPRELGKGLSFQVWEKAILACGGNNHDVLKGWFDLLTPKEIELTRLEKELEKCFSEENIGKIEFFKTLSKEEMEYLKKINIDKQFILMLSGRKPAWFCEHGFNGKIDFNKIKLNPKIKEKFDVVKLAHGQLCFLNKKEVLKIIEENRDIYSAGLGVSESTNVDDIYEAFLKMLTNRDIKSGQKNDALFGIALGFPRHSSMIYELENNLLKSSKEDLRANIPLFKTRLLRLLKSNKSPYAGYPENVIKNLEAHIRAMDSIASGGNIIQCVVFGDEKRAVDKISRLEKDFEENFKVEDLM